MASVSVKGICNVKLAMKIQQSIHLPPSPVMKPMRAHFSDIQRSELIWGVTQWWRGAVHLCDNAMIDQRVSAENEPSLAPDARLLWRQYDSPQVSPSMVRADSVIGCWYTAQLLLQMNEPDVSGSASLSLSLSPALSLPAYLGEVAPVKANKTRAPRVGTEPVGLSLGQHTMTKRDPAVIVSPCLMWPDDGSSLAWRWDPDELSGSRQL